MAQIYRQLGKRFLKRFQTDNEFIEKKDVGADNDNIVVVADADRLAQADFISLVVSSNNTNLPPEISPDTIAFLSASPGLSGIFDPGSTYLPSFIVFDKLHISFYGETVAAPANASYSFTFRINAIPRLVGGASFGSTISIFDQTHSIPITASENKSYNYSVDLGLRVPISDLTKANDKSDSSLTFMQVLASLQSFIFGSNWTAANFSLRKVRIYLYWHVEF